MVPGKRKGAELGGAGLGAKRRSVGWGAKERGPCQIARALWPPKRGGAKGESVIFSVVKGEGAFRTKKKKKNTNNGR